jgi:integrase
LDKLNRTIVKALVIHLLDNGMQPSSARTILQVLTTMLGTAVDDGILAENPTARVAKRMHLRQLANGNGHAPKAMTREQLQAFLETASAVDYQRGTFLFLLARTGLRIGEGLALQVPALRFDDATLSVMATLGARGSLQATKTGHDRIVHLTPQLVTRLRGHLDRTGNTTWVFCSRSGHAWDPAWIRRFFDRCLELAGLPSHFHPHSLRHTYASLLISTGASLEYVKKQLGHTSISLTVDLYGSHLPHVEHPSDGLDD